MKLILYILFIFIFCVSSLASPHGTWRWSVKTGSDMNKPLCEFTSSQISFSSMLQHDLFYKLSSNTPRLADEYMCVSVVGFIQRFKQEADGDLHIIFSQDSSLNCVVVCECPFPDLDLGREVSNNSFYFNSLRNFLINLKFAKYSGWFILNKPLKVNLTGFLFHDMRHRMNYLHAPNFLEIHPVFKIDTIF